MNSAILIFALVGAYPLGPNFALGPSHWNADVHAPQAFYPTELNLIADRTADMRDCNLPDPGPSVFIDYFYADWCGDCAASKRYASELDRKGYNIISRNAGSKDASGYARACRVTSVPTWLVRMDGREVLRTNDSWKVDAWLRNNKPNAKQQAGQRTYPVSAGTVYAPDGSRAPIGYRIGACVTDGNGNCVTPMQYGQPVYYQQVGFWQRGPARRWLSNRGGWIRNGNHPILRFLFRRRG